MADQQPPSAPPAPGAAFTFRGKEYTLPRAVQADKRALHAWANARAVADVWAMEPLVHEGVLTPQQFAEERSLTNQRVTSGFYWWDEPGGVAVRFTTAGLVRLCWLCLKRADPTVPLAVVEDMTAADNGTFLWRQYSLANADPTAPRPAGAGGGETSTPGSSASGASASGDSTG